MATPQHLTTEQATGPQLAAAHALATAGRHDPSRIKGLVLDADGHVSAVCLGREPGDELTTFVLNFNL